MDLTRLEDDMAHENIDRERLYITLLIVET